MHNNNFNKSISKQSNKMNTPQEFFKLVLYKNYGKLKRKLNDIKIIHAMRNWIETFKNYSR